MVNQVQVNSLVIGYSFKYTDKIKCFSVTSHMSHSIGSPRSFSVSAYMLTKSKLINAERETSLLHHDL